MSSNIKRFVEGLDGTELGGCSVIVEAYNFLLNRLRNTSSSFDLYVDEVFRGSGCSEFSILGRVGDVDDALWVFYSVVRGLGFTGVFLDDVCCYDSLEGVSFRDFSLRVISVVRGSDSFVLYAEGSGSLCLKKNRGSYEVVYSIDIPDYEEVVEAREGGTLKDLFLDYRLCDF